MNQSEFQAELDAEWKWRAGELTRLKSLISSEFNNLLRDEFRKSLVVMLYSHFEGFCVFALQHYRGAVNDAKLACRDAVPAVVAGAWSPVFAAMQTGDSKCKVFKNSLPKDDALHLHWRRRHFVEEVDCLKDITVEIPEEVIDAESNLKSSVLKRNLFVLGLDHMFVDPYVSSIERLLTTRNGIAHGERLKGVPELDYEELSKAVTEICERLIELLTQAHRDQAFRR